MSTRAEIAIPTADDRWVHVYVHYDGYPGAMLPALARWQPEDVLAAQEIRSITTGEIEPFTRPRAPAVRAEPQKGDGIEHLYVFEAGAWRHLPDAL